MIPGHVVAKDVNKGCVYGLTLCKSLVRVWHTHLVTRSHCPFASDRQLTLVLQVQHVFT